MEIILWIVFYLVVWSLFNSYFKWKIFKSGKWKCILFITFFLVSSILFDILFYKNLAISIYTLICAMLISTLIGIFFSIFPPFYKHITNGRSFLLWMPSDIFLQQAMIITAISILRGYFGTGYSDLYFGLFFITIHLPILFFKWVKLRYLVVAFTFVLGFIFSYLIRSFGETGVLIAFLLHFCMYIPVFYYLRDERIV